MLREVNVSIVESTVKRLFIEANMKLPNDVYSAICHYKNVESSNTGKAVLSTLIDNVNAAE